MDIISYYTVNLEKAYMVQLTDGNPQSIVIKDNKTTQWNYIAFSKNKIYQTNMVNNTVTCYKD